MIRGATCADRRSSVCAARLTNHFAAFSLFIAGALVVGWGVTRIFTEGSALPFWALPTIGAAITVISGWRLVRELVVIPRQAIVWFQYERPTLEYRRRGDLQTRRFRTLDILRIETATDRHGQIERYRIRFVGGTTLVIEPRRLENGEALAEQLAADIAHSPRWMFS